MSLRRFEGIGLLLIAWILLQVCSISALPASASGSRSKRADRDHDGLSNRFERRHSHTSPRRRDTDRDRLSDGYEVRSSHTKPRRKDSDRDRLSDGYEVRRSHTNPRRRDSDRDGVGDWAELRRSHTNPRKRDTDGDGLSDGQERQLGSNPRDAADPAVPKAARRDTAAPDTAIASGPFGTVASSSASFSFSGSDNATQSSRLRFQCRLDGGKWGSCTSPKAYSGLADRGHTFDVRAKDAAGNVDPSPASRTWIVDTLNASFTYSPGAPHTGEQVSFDAAASTCMATPCQYRWVDVGSDGPGGTDWDLGSGRTMDFTFEQAGTKHTELTVTNAVGVSDSVERDVVVGSSLDTIAPDTMITASPPADTTSTSASFSFTSAEAGSSYECRLDGSAWAACSSPKAYSGLADGWHTFDVRATDAAGNVDASPASRTWTIDTTAPDTSITSGPSGTVTNSSASFSFTSTDASAGFDCRIDGGAWGTCSSPKSFSGLTSGLHTFDVRARDGAGNVDGTPASRTWTVSSGISAAFTLSPSSPQTGEDVTFDATGSACLVGPCQYDWVDLSDDGPGGTDWPLGSGQVLHFTFSYVGTKYVQLTVTDATGAKSAVEHNVIVTAPPADTTAPDTTITASPPVSTTSTSAGFSFSGSDNVGVGGYECQLDGGSWNACSSPKAYSGLSAGSHTFQVRANDAAGNVDASPASYSWSIDSPADTTPPDTSIDAGPSGSVASPDASFSFSSSESGSTFECRFDGGSWGACSSPKSYSGLPSASHTFDVRATDAAGNVDPSPASRSWSVSAGGGGCAQTLSPGANVAGAVSSAANGSTICLNNGDYGTVNLWNIARSGYVTLKSASGRGATLKPSVGNSDYIRLDNLTLHDGLVNSCSTNIQFTNSTFQPGQSGLYFDGSACGSTTTNYLVDNVSFSNVNLANYEGRLNFRDVNGATVSNSFFGNNGYGDGIQTQGNSRNLTIGPNNTFDGIVQSFCDANGGAHCDAIQLQGGGATAITGNYFKNGDTYIMAPDGSSNVTTTGNVFDGSGRNYEWKIQFGSAANPSFRHNTIINASAAFDSKTGNPATSGAQIKDNIWAKGYGQIKTSGGSGCSACSFSYNLFDNPTNAKGTNNVIGTPSFTGGTNATTYTGWHLTTTSPGHNAASDTTDIGIP